MIKHKMRYILTSSFVLFANSGCSAPEETASLEETETLNDDADAETQVRLYEAHVASKQARASTDQRLKGFARALAKAVQDPDVGLLLKQQLGEKFDGDNDVLWSKLKTRKVGGVALRDLVRAELTKAEENDELANIEQVPFLNIAMPRQFESWDGRSPVLVAYVPTTLDDKELDTIEAYDASGELYVLDAWAEPPFPVLVTSTNERMDPSTGRLRPEYAQREEDLAVDDLVPDLDLAPELIGSQQLAVMNNGAPDFFMQYLYLFNDHEPWAKGSAEILVKLLTDSGKKIDLRFTEKNDGNFYNLRSLLFKYFDDVTRFISIRLDEDDGGTPIKINLGLEYTPKMSDLGVKTSAEFTIRDDDDYIGVNELIDLRPGPLLPSLDTPTSQFGNDANRLFRVGDAAVSFWWSKAHETVIMKGQMLPYNDSNTTAGKGNDWAITGFPHGDDYAYMLDIGSSMTVDITTCAPETNFDTMLELFDRNGPRGQMNDDDFSCGMGSGIRASTLRGVFLNPGVYWLVVDGYSGQTGQFHLTISPTP